jgi:hypothetical protein
MAPKRQKTAHRHTRKPGRRLTVIAECPIQVSTPPVRIIGDEHRHEGGFCLSDR